MKKLLALLALVSTSALAIPSEITAEYQLTNKGITIGRVTETFQRRGDTYQISSVSRSEGILKVLYDEQITLQSAGRVNATGLQPLRFEEKRTRESKRDVNATFDWSQGIMQSRFRGETSQHPLPPETQDRISMMYQFMHLKPRSGNLVMSMSNGRKVEVWLAKQHHNFPVRVVFDDPKGLRVEQSILALQAR